MNNMNFEIDPKTYEEIAKVIHSDESPVGIDAKKTHILILNKLQELNDRLERIEQSIWNYQNSLVPVNEGLFVAQLSFK